METKKFFSDIPITDMIRVTSLANPTTENVAKALPGRPAQEIAAISALLHGRMAEFEAALEADSATVIGAAAAPTEPLGGDPTAPIAPTEPLTTNPVEAHTELPQPEDIPQTMDAEKRETPEPSEAAEAAEAGGNDWDLQVAAVVAERRRKHRTVNKSDFIRNLELDMLAPYAWGASDEPVGELHVVLVEVEPKKAFLYWEPVEIPDKPVVMYRVIGADTEQARSPENGTTMVVTKGTAFEEQLDPLAGMRHYMVWAYAGKTVADIFDAQPVLVGEQALALPPMDFSIAETGGIVTGTWTPLKGHSNVAVFVRQRGSEEPLDSPIHQLRVGVDARSFSYTVPVRGATYEFQVFPEITFGGHTMRGEGSHIETRTISADIEAVELLSVFPMSKEGKDVIILNWIAPPTGEVKIYLTQSEPAPDLIGKAVDSVYIHDDDALGSTEWIATIESEPGEEVHRELIWPAGWSQVFCVPVNVVGEQSLVGHYQAVNRVENITEYSLVQRVDSQLITFDWPDGAQLVEVACRQGDAKELIEEDYRRQGGIRVHLNPFGDEVTLTPKSIYAGLTTKANPTVINYPGLKTYAYKIDRTEADKNYAVLWVWRVGTEDRHPPQFMLTHNPERFPLYPSDGQPVELAEIQENEFGRPGQWMLPSTLPGSQAEARAQGAGWAANTQGLTSGYLRLFIRSDDRDAENPGSRIVIDDETIVDLKIN